MNFKSRLTTAIATGAVLLNALAPVAIAQEVTVSGNGAFSDSTANVTSSSTTNVSQTNVANVTNNVEADAETGENDANFNTGGDVMIGTGNATTNVGVSNNLNSNAASLDCDCITGGDTKVTIAGNGAFSDNTAKVTSLSSVNLDQTNVANVTNNVEADAETGENDANFNTGGTVMIGTGNASATVLVSTTANANSASIGGGAGSGNGSSVTISGNGAFSDNTVNLTGHSAVVLDQTNVANVTNNVEADAETGENDANFNTGGDVLIGTGTAKANVAVSNLLNFNAASVDCDCIFGDGVKVSIDGNGAFSDNVVNLTDLNTLLLGQVNVAHLTNNVEADAETGENDVKFNTGKADVSVDPSVHTGDATDNVSVSNTANSNVFSTASLPTVEVNFSLVALWSALLSLLV